MVPDEIQQDPYALDLYERALKDGKEKDRSVRINIVGNFRQGKTSLMRRLLGQKVTDVSSTDGIDVIHYKCHRKVDGTFSFKKAQDDKDQSDIVERLVSVALANEKQKDVSSITEKVIYRREPKLPIVTTTPETRASHGSKNVEKRNEEQARTETYRPQQNKIGSPNTDKPISGALKQPTSLENKSKQSVLSENERKTFAKKLTKRKLKSEGNETKTMLDIWDFGGQYIFYATHSLFHSTNAIYLLVFDLSLKLKSLFVDEDYPGESDDKDVEYFIHFWMNSIHSFVGSADGLQPKVILVGTHKDKVTGSAKAKSQHIDEYFDEIRALFDGTKLLNHIHLENFAVDNSIENDEAIFMLRETILQLADEKLETVEIPARWIQLEKSLSKLAHLKIISFEHVLSIDEGNDVPVGDSEQIKVFLRYHHSKGTLIYFDEKPFSEHIVLEPQYLIDAFKSIITSERFCKNDPEVRHLWKKLQTDGRLEEALIDKKWEKAADKKFMEHKEILISFLTKHHIISEATTFDETTQSSTRLGWFVVPSLLKTLLPQFEIEQLLKGRKKTIVCFVMLFDNSTIVPTIYHRLMAALIGKWPIVSFGKKNLISKDKCVVQLNFDHAGIAEMRYDTVELTVVSLCLSSPVCPKHADNFRRFSETLVIREFSKLAMKYEDNTKPYKTCYRCSHETHNESRSDNYIEIDELVDKNLIPCPDLFPHDIDVQEARIQWFKDHKAVLPIFNSELNDKILSKLSRCIGKNWQILGFELGVTQVQMEHISQDHPHSTEMRIYYMLKSWFLQSVDTVDMNVLVQKMQNCSNVSIQWDAVRNICDDMDQGVICIGFV